MENRKPEFTFERPEGLPAVRDFFFLITFIGYNTSDDNTYIYMEEK